MKRLNLLNTPPFGELTVVGVAPCRFRDSKAIYYWYCMCSCQKDLDTPPKFSQVSTSDLRSGKVTKCWECGRKSQAEKLKDGKRNKQLQ